MDRPRTRHQCRTTKGSAVFPQYASPKRVLQKSTPQEETVGDMQHDKTLHFFGLLPSLEEMLPQMWEISNEI